MKIHVITSKEIDKKALTELSEIISCMEEGLRLKIPQDLRDIIEQNKDTSYEFKYEKNVSLMPETKALLSVILSEYVSSDQNKEKWKTYDKRATEIIENEKREKYSVDVFGNNENNKETIDKTDTNLPTEPLKESWFKKIVNRIKSFFRKD